MFTGIAYCSPRESIGYHTSSATTANANTKSLTNLTITMIQVITSLVRALNNSYKQPIPMRRLSVSSNSVP